MALSVNWGDVARGATSGAGDYLKAGADKEQNAINQKNELSRDLASTYLNQQKLQQGNAANVLSSKKPGDDIDPFAKMAMTRAILGNLQPGTTSNNIGGSVKAPAGMGQFMPQVTGGLMLQPPKQAALPGRSGAGDPNAPGGGEPGSEPMYSAPGLADVANKFYSDDAIMNAMRSQNQARINADPNYNPGNTGASIFGSGANGLMQDQQEMLTNAQQRQQGYENPARQALLDAIKGTENSGGSSVWGGILSTLLGGLGSIPLGGGGGKTNPLPTDPATAGGGSSKRQPGEVGGGNK